MCTYPTWRLQNRQLSRGSRPKLTPPPPAPCDSGHFPTTTPTKVRIAFHPNHTTPQRGEGRDPQAKPNPNHTTTPQGGRGSTNHEGGGDGGAKLIGKDAVTICDASSSILSSTTNANSPRPARGSTCPLIQSKVTCLLVDRYVRDEIFGNIRLFSCNHTLACQLAVSLLLSLSLC